MPCSPSDNSINIAPSPGIPIPGLGIPTSPFQIPLPNIDLPLSLIEDFLSLLQLTALFPSGVFKPNPDFGMSSVLDFIANLLSQLAPFLSFYNFIMAALNLIICIIEVLCAIPNPFAVAIKLKKLFAECLPPFLNLFPWMALIAMILAMLLLILALVIYIIETIVKIIEELIKNLILLGHQESLQDGTAALAIAQKIASLLCLIENILSVLLAVAAILAVIKALMAFSGSSICSDEDGEGCCPTEICPPFLRENNSISVTNGEFVYLSRVNLDVSSLPVPAALSAAMSSSLAPLREERWQLFDTDPDPEWPIDLIITPPPTAIPVFGPQIFYPDQNFDASTPLPRAPYTVDMRLFIDPSTFHPTDVGGSRYMRINECIVVRKPYVGEITYNSPNNPIQNGSTGTFNLEGGKVFEDDGETVFNVKRLVGSLIVDAQATLNEFISYTPTSSQTLPAADDSYRITNVEFTWKPNHPALASHNLITVGCFPSVHLEKLTQNLRIAAEGTESVLDKLANAPDGDLVPSTGVLPNVAGTQECVQNALNKFKSNITLETTAEFQATMESCLNDLKYQTITVFCGAFIAAVSQFQSTFSLDTDIQFTTRAITISTILRDAGGTNIATNIPDECLDNIVDSLEAEVTLGTATKFVYDKENVKFNSILTSSEPGDGEVRVLFKNQVLSTLTPSTNFNVPSSIDEDVINYTFVDGVDEAAVRRDESDVAKS